MDGHISGAGKLNKAGRTVLVIVKHSVKFLKNYEYGSKRDKNLWFDHRMLKFCIFEALEKRSVILIPEFII